MLFASQDVALHEVDCLRCEVHVPVGQFSNAECSVFEQKVSSSLSEVFHQDLIGGCERDDFRARANEVVARGLPFQDELRHGGSSGDSVPHRHSVAASAASRKAPGHDLSAHRTGRAA